MSRSAEQSIIDSLLTVTVAVAAEVGRSGDASQLTVAQLPTLRLLDGRDRSAGEPARTLRVAMPTVNQSTDVLVARGLVEHSTGTSGRRQVRLATTRVGRRTFAEWGKSVEEYLSMALSSMSPGRTEDLAAALGDMEDAVPWASLAEATRAMHGTG